MINVICFGDSNTYGYNPENGERYKENERWTSLLQKFLGGDFNVAEEGLNGRTLASDRDGFDYLNGLKHLPTILLTHKPVDVLIIMLGTNDCNIQLNLNEKDLEKGTRALIKKAREVLLWKGEPLPNIILMAPAPIGNDIKNSPFAHELSDKSVSLSKKLADIQRQVAIEEDCYFFDAGSVAKVSEIDSEHLTKEGHLELAFSLYNMLLSMYKEKLTDEFFDMDVMLETDRLELRLVNASDTKDLHKNIFNSDDALKYFISNKKETEEETRLTLLRSRAIAISNRLYYFSVIRKDTKEVIGIVLQGNKQDNLFVGTEIGYAFGKEHWNKGYATEAVKAVIDFLLSKGVHRVFATHIPANIASGKVMQKCGMKEEGTTLDEIYYHDTYYNLKYYSIINKEQFNY